MCLNVFVGNLDIHYRDYILNKDQAIFLYIVILRGWYEKNEMGIDIDHLFDLTQIFYLSEIVLVRFPIYSDKHCEVPKQLLLLNHNLHAEEVKKTGLWEETKVKKNAKSIQVELWVRGIE